MKKVKLKFGMDIEALQKALQSESQRVKQLEEQNRQLKKQLEKARTMNAKQRQRMKSQAGALKSARTQIKKLRVSLKKAKVAGRSAGRPAIKSVTHRTRAQYLEQAKPGFIKRFIERLHEAYADFKPEWDEVVRVALMSLSYDEIDSIMRMLNLDSMYYESNGYRPNTGATGQMIYDYFVQFIPSVAA